MYTINRERDTHKQNTKKNYTTTEVTAALDSVLFTLDVKYDYREGSLFKAEVGVDLNLLFKNSNTWVGHNAAHAQNDNGNAAPW